MRRLGRAAFGFMTGAALLLALPAGAAIFGILDTGELYSSSNGGATWSPLAALPANDVVGMAAFAATTDLFATTRSGSVYRSTNGGTTWSAVGAVTASDVASFTINYDGAVLVLTRSGTLYRSLNAGVAFTALAAFSASNLVAITRGPLGRLYVAAESGEIYESQDQGATWAPVGSVAASNVVSLRRKGAELYLLSQTGEVYRSLDYGRGWLPVGAITASNLASILDAGPGLLAATATGEVYGSSSGTAWAAVGAINQLNVMALGSDTPLATGIAEEGVPRAVIATPFPNPARSRVGSTFSITTTGRDWVRLDLYDARGRRVATRGVEAFASAGLHQPTWKPQGIAAGTYYVRVTTGSGLRRTVRWTLVP